MCGFWPAHVLGHEDAFLLGLVGEHRARDHVADREDAGHAGLQVLVDDHASFVVELNAGNVLKTEVGSVRSAADGHEAVVRF